MKVFFKKLWRVLNEPRPALLVLTYLLTAVFITGSFVMLAIGFEDSALSVVAYVLFGLSALGLTYSVYTFVIFFPDIKKGISSKMRMNAFINRLIYQYSFRTLVFASITFVINLAYVVFHVVVAVLSRSVWYAALADYYILITVMRGGIVLYHRKKRKNSDNASEENDKLLEIKKYRTCGILLVVMPLCLSVAIAEMVSSDKGYSYGGWIIYAVAAYTFYKITMAIINVVKARKSYGVTIEAIRNIGLADALVSLLALQTAMFHSFGQEGVDSAFANAMTGAVVCILTAAIGVIMIINSVKFKRKLENEAGNE